MVMLTKSEGIKMAWNCLTNSSKPYKNDVDIRSDKGGIALALV